MKAERNPQLSVPQKINKVGRVFCAKFLDREVAQESGASNFIAGRWIFVASANHALVIEWRTGRFQHIRTELLDGKASMSACTLPISGCVAIGGNDGVIRVWNLAKSAIIAKLSGPHLKSAITGLAASGWTLMSGSSDGTVCLWDIRKEAPLSSNAITKAHNSVTEIAAGSKGFISLGSEKQAIVWNENGRERLKAKLPIKPWAAAAMADGSFAVRT